MASEFTIRAVNDWRKEIQPPMASALRVSMDVWRRDAQEATKHMLILMAQSARAQTPQAKQRRKVQRDDLGEYVEVIRGGEAKKRYKWQYSEGAGAKASALNEIGIYGTGFKSLTWTRGTWESAQEIRNRGLAKRSWMWGLGKGSNPIPGASEVGPISRGARTIGWQKVNRLNYIDAIMPAGYQRTAETKAVNKLLKQAETRMVRDFERRVGVR